MEMDEVIVKKIYSSFSACLINAAVKKYNEKQMLSGANLLYIAYWAEFARWVESNEKLE